MKTVCCAILIVVLVLVTASIASTDSLIDIQVFPRQASIALGRTQQFQLFGFDAQWNAFQMEGPITWSFGNMTAGIVDSNGLLTATNATARTGISAAINGVVYSSAEVEIQLPTLQDGYCLERRWWPLPPVVGIPRYLACDPLGVMYIRDAHYKCIWRFGRDGGFVGRLDLQPLPGGQSPWLGCMATDSKSSLYVHDGYYGIQKYAPDGSYLGHVVSRTSGKYMLGQCMMVDTQANIYLASGSSYTMVTKFSSDGTYLAGYKVSNRFGASSVAVDTSGNMYVAQPAANAVQKISPDGDATYNWRDGGTALAIFSTPMSVATDTKGNVYVLEKGSNRVQKLDANGYLVAQWSVSSDSSYPTYSSLPSGIAVDARGHVRTYLNRFEEFAPASSFTVGQAKHLPDTARAKLYEQVVSAGTSDMNGTCFYVESPNKLGGVKVTGLQAERGQTVSVYGTWATVRGEREIQAIEVAPTGTGSVVSVYVNLTSLGGGKFGYQDATWAWTWTEVDGEEQLLWMPMAGLNTVGLLVRTSGEVVSAYQGNYFVLSNDGGELVRTACTCAPGIILPQKGDFVVVTGICSCQPNRSPVGLVPVLRIRDQNDIQIIHRSQ